MFTFFLNIRVVVEKIHIFSILVNIVIKIIYGEKVRNNKDYVLL